MKKLTVEIAKREAKRFVVTDTMELTPLETELMVYTVFKGKEVKYMERDGKYSIYSDTDRFRMSVEDRKAYTELVQDLTAKQWACDPSNPYCNGKEVKTYFEILTDELLAEQGTNKQEVADKVAQGIQERDAKVIAEGKQMADGRTAIDRTMILETLGYDFLTTVNALQVQTAIENGIRLACFQPWADFVTIATVPKWRIENGEHFVIQIEGYDSKLVLNHEGAFVTTPGQMHPLSQVSRVHERNMAQLVDRLIMTTKAEKEAKAHE